MTSTQFLQNRCLELDYTAEDNSGWDLILAQALYKVIGNLESGGTHVGGHTRRGAGS